MASVSDRDDAIGRAPVPATLTPEEVLALAREQTGMDVAFLVEHTPDAAIVRAVDGNSGSFGISPGRVVPIEQTVSRLIVEGAVPNLISDTTRDGRLREMPIVRELGVGSLAGVPVVLSDGTVYGVLACAAHTPDPTLCERDVRFLRLLAVALAAGIEQAQARVRELDREAERIRETIEAQGVSMVFQPIVALAHRNTVGFEALARFPDDGERGPAAWFAEAARVDLGPTLEMVAVRAALARLPELPPDAWLAVNVSLDTLLAPSFRETMAGAPDERIVVEVSEHTRIEDYRPVIEAIGELHELGARLAIDDAGGGFESLSHMLQLAPDIIKIDTFVTRGVDTDPVRRAVVTSIAMLAAEIRAQVVAEGVETAAELSQLRALSVGHGQGMLLGAPAPLPA